MWLITRLEKSKSFLFLLIISITFFFLRFPSIIEPYWYGDEGIYEVLGQAIHSGRLLYTGIWDNKPPLLYLIYALFNGDQANVRLLSLFVGLATTIAFFYLAKQLFQKLRPTLITTSVFALLFATPYVEGNIANAENFMLLPITLAALLVYKTINHTPYAIRHLLFSAGLLLGIAFLFKIVAVFDLAAFLLFLFIINSPSKLSLSVNKHHKKELGVRNHELWKTLIPHSLFIILGFIIPLLITTLFFAAHHALFAFIKGAFLGNVGYVGYGNQFLNIPQGLLIFKLLLLAATISIIFLKRNTVSKPVLFILLWMAFSLFNAFFSQRPYTHYLLVLLPSFCLFIGLVFLATTRRMRIVMVISLLALAFLIKENFWMHSFTGTLRYYQNTLAFLTGHKSVKAYQTFFDSKTPRDYELASFIKGHTKPNENVFIWGNNAQIYALSGKLPPNQYTVAYHILQNKEAIAQTQQAINTVKPKYIITLSEAPLLPFTVPFYTMRFMLPKATIYERIF